MIALRNLKLDEVGEWVRNLIRDEIGKLGLEAAPEKPQPSKKSSAAKKAVAVALAIGVGLMFSPIVSARIQPRNLDSSQTTEEWVFGSAIVLSPNPSSSVDTWGAQTGMIYFDSEAGAVKVYDGTSWISLTGN